MKLHLPLGLLSSLIACMAAVSSPHALAETYTWLGGTDGWIHTNANWNPAPTNYAKCRRNRSAILCNSVDRPLNNVQKAVKAQFNSLSLGGINVAAGASGFSVSSSDGGSRVVNFRAPGEGRAAVFFQHRGRIFSLGINRYGLGGRFILCEYLVPDRCRQDHERLWSACGWGRDY